MIVICRLPIRIIIWIVSPIAMREERDAHDVDQRRQRAARLRRNQPVEEVDVDVARAAHRRRDADEHRADQQVARDLLGPRRRVVQHVAREELVEHAQAEQPEEAERQPVLDHVVRQVDRRVGRRGSGPRRRGRARRRVRPSLVVGHASPLMTSRSERREASVRSSSRKADPRHAFARMTPAACRVLAARAWSVVT